MSSCSSASSPKRARLRVLDSERRHYRWVDDVDARELIRGGLARAFGRKVVRGLILLVPAAVATAGGWGKPALTPRSYGRNTTRREHVADRWYVCQHAPADPGYRRLAAPFAAVTA